MSFHQAPTDGQPHPEAHFHVEFYPAYRMPGRLKYLAGSEMGAGVFTADTLPEEKAKELQAVTVDWNSSARHWHCLCDTMSSPSFEHSSASRRPCVRARRAA